MKNIIVVAAFLCVASIVCGQETFRESKVLAKELAYNDGEEIQINGERTFIEIVEWDKSAVLAEVEVISRYNNQEQAKTDLEKVIVQFDKKRGTIYYSNALKIKSAADKPKSNIKTVLKLYVPAYSKVIIKNAFGELMVSGSVKELNCNSQFSTSTFKDYKGKLVINSKYGKIKIEDASGDVKATASRSDLALIRVGGELEATLSYGKLDMTFSESDAKFDITTDYTPVTLILPDGSKQGLDLGCKDCDINMDNCSKIVDEEISKGNHSIKISAKNSTKTNAKIRSKHEDITIISTNSISSSN